MMPGIIEKQKKRFFRRRGTKRTTRGDAGGTPTKGESAPHYSPKRGRKIGALASGANKEECLSGPRKEINLME